MGEINDAAMLNALRRQMTLTAARQVVAASNLANVNTPGYKAKEVTSFGETLDQQLSGAGRLVTTSLRHLTGAPADPNVAETTGLPERRDGNNVQLDQELLAMTRASGDFAAAQTALAAKFRLIRYALTESR
jgi:flagellar basal-body rod protein FlgB